MPCVTLLDQRQHGPLQFVFINIAARLEPLAPIVALELAQKVEAQAKRSKASPLVRLYFDFLGSFFARPHRYCTNGLTPMARFHNAKALFSPHQNARNLFRSACSNRTGDSHAKNACARRRAPSRRIADAELSRGYKLACSSRKNRRGAGVVLFTRDGGLCRGMLLGNAGSVRARKRRRGDDRRLFRRLGRDGPL